jgi:hypothetical protein
MLMQILEFLRGMLMAGSIGLGMWICCIVWMMVRR